MIVGLALFLVAGVLSNWLTETSPGWWHVLYWGGVLSLLRAGFRWSGMRPHRLYAGSAVMAWLVFEGLNLWLLDWFYVRFPASMFQVPLTMLLGGCLVVAIRWLAELIPISSWPARRSPRPPTAAIVGAVLLTAGFLLPGWALLAWCAPPFLVHDYLARQSANEVGELDGLLHRPDWLLRVVLAGAAAGIICYVAASWLGSVRLSTMHPGLPAALAHAPLGVFGFPLAAVSLYSLQQAFAAFWHQRANHPERFMQRITCGGLVLGALLITLAVGRFMTHRTVSSTVTRVADLPAAAAVAHLLPDTLDVPDIVAWGDQRMAEETGMNPAAAMVLWNQAALSMVHGMGSEHVEQLQRSGIIGLCDFHTQTAEEIWLTIHALFRGLGPRPTPGEVALWRSAAIRACPVTNAGTS